MGLNAFVLCNCWKEGKTTVPPINRELIYYDEDNDCFSVHCSEGTSNEEKWRLEDLIKEWARNCCIHPNMKYCDEHIGNWSSVRELQQAVIKCADTFTVLPSIFPSCNGGCVEPEIAEKALQELDMFCQNLEKQNGLYLIDAKSGDKIYAYIAGYKGVFAFSGDIGTGFDHNGLFVHNEKTGEEYFRSMHVTQELLEPEERVSVNGESYTSYPSLLMDIASGKTYRNYFTIGGEKSGYTELKVIMRPLLEADFYSIEPLRKVLRASVETKNPVCWG